MPKDGRILLVCFGRSCWHRESPHRLLTGLFLLFSLLCSSCFGLNGSEAAMEGSMASLPYETSTNEGSNRSDASLLHAAERGDAITTEMQGSTAATFASLDRTLRHPDEGPGEAQQQDTASAAAAPAAAQPETLKSIPGAAAASQTSSSAAAGSLRRSWIGAVILVALIGLGVSRQISKKPVKVESQAEDQTEIALLHSLERLEELVPLLRPAQRLAGQLNHPDASKFLWEFEQNLTDAKSAYSQIHQHHFPAALALDTLEPPLSNATSAARQLQRMARLESAQIFDDMEKAAASLEPLSKPVFDLLESTIGPDYAWGLNRFLDSLKETVNDLMQRSQGVYCRLSASNRLLTAGADLRFLDVAASHMVFAVKQWQQATEDAMRITRNILVRSIASKSHALSLIFVAQHKALEEASRQLGAQEETAGDDPEGVGKRQETLNAINRSMEVLNKSRKLLEEQKANLDALQAKNELGEILIAFQATEVATISTESFLETNLTRFKGFPLLRHLFYLHLGEGFKKRAEKTMNRAPAALQVATMLRNSMHAELGKYASTNPSGSFVNEEIFKVLLEAGDGTLDRLNKIKNDAVYLSHAISSKQDGKRLSDLISKANNIASLLDDTASDAERLWLKGRFVKLLELDMQDTDRCVTRSMGMKSASETALATLKRDWKRAALDAIGVPTASQIAEAAARMRLAAHYMFLITSGAELDTRTTNHT
ncbi:hypothetical protein Emag_005884 [Eimeria magna]